MRKIILTRLGSFAAVLFCVTILVFALMRLAPGDAAYMQLEEFGVDLTAENLDAARVRLGLNKPMAAQYAHWLGRVLRLDLGRSSVTGRPVLPEFLAHLKYTALLSVPALLLIVVIAVPLGALSAMYERRALDHLTRGASILLLSAPAFCVGLALILLLSVRLRLLPSFGAESPKHLIMPCVTLSLGAIASYTRFMRGAVLDELSRDYVRAARARGIAPGVIVWRGAMRNAAIPMVTSLCMSLGLLLGGSSVVEKIFSWPGVGKFLIDAIMQRDYAVVQCCVLLFAVFFAALNLAADLICMGLDPKLRTAGRGRRVW
ncbi:MAG: ABC transporter permease [Oscillospiraceae bacterium]|jgi:ABC-type dipeptide/oligopeptide/nickel transport system permease component|nr:ABC transporter permease [Oscillospiraceae bacterium]